MIETGLVRLFSPATILTAATCTFKRLYPCWGGAMPSLFSLRWELKEELMGASSSEEHLNAAVPNGASQRTGKLAAALREQPLRQGWLRESPLP